ncbi:hypothetical protein, partial [Mesorhizobium sp.]|uniref:hypothetical protein n=1 Tax=Mesorhizobium sp. TaxID=1871066 RepID=UPI0025DBED62
MIEFNFADFCQATINSLDDWHKTSSLPSEFARVRIFSRSPESGLASCGFNISHGRTQREPPGSWRDRSA